MVQVRFYFNPRPPQGERRYSFAVLFGGIRFQSTPPARGATCYDGFNQRTVGISIHAPRKGSDEPPVDMAALETHFNPRPPQGERLNSTSNNKAHNVFQSTPPARGATNSFRWERFSYLISIHAPRKGSDVQLNTMMSRVELFQSTPPARGATGGKVYSGRGSKISIHAPRKGSD